ncbi:MAG: hypothetical protein M1834_003471 [Cirrosporium novae-zelandiae]|nr:MAG: hypothetical protein M1834_003471 [Cirrosporium novae-zelandiae]
MSQIQLHNPEFKFVEVGRIVLEDGKLAAIIQIIDHKRVLLEGPQVPRHAAALKNISLTKVKIDNLTFGAQHASLVSKWKESKIEEQYSKTPWAKRYKNAYLFRLCVR